MRIGASQGDCTPTVGAQGLDVLHLSRTDEVLDVCSLHVELAALSEAHHTAICSDDLTHAGVADPNLYVHILGGFCIGSQVQHLCAPRDIVFHVPVQYSVVPM